MSICDWNNNKAEIVTIEISTISQAQKQPWRELHLEIWSIWINHLKAYIREIICTLPSSEQAAMNFPGLGICHLEMSSHGRKRLTGIKIITVLTACY